MAISGYNWTDINPNGLTGEIQPWIFEWSDLAKYMDYGGNYMLTGALVPTPTTCRTQAIDSFEWHHTAPAVGFKITRKNSTITITSFSEEAHYNAPAYSYDGGYCPQITFYYTNSEGKKVKIGAFGGGIPSDYRGATRSLTVTENLSQSALYVTCSHENCFVYINNGPQFLGYIKLHTHITNPEPPKLVQVTGTTIKVKSVNGVDFYRTTYPDVLYNGTFTFNTENNNIKQGKTYYFRSLAKCPDCPDNKQYKSDGLEVTTWKISGSCTKNTTHSLTFKATHVAGTGGDASEHDIRYRLYTKKDTSSTRIATLNSANGGSVTFTGLDQDKTYHCIANTVGITDNSTWIEGRTKGTFSGGSSTGDVSATTLRTTVSWTESELETTCIVTCNGVSRQCSNGERIGFTGLNKNTTYTVSWVITDTEGNETNGSYSLTTKQARFTTINRSTKSIQFASESVNTSDDMEQRLGSDDWDYVSENELLTYDYLPHNTAYTIYCRIAGCYAFDSSGNETSYNDSEESLTVYTRLLSLTGSIYEQHQHSLITLWQAKVDGVNTDMDSIDGTEFEFTYMSTIARKANPPYQASEIIEGNDGETYGEYLVDKKIYSDNLTWYYCEYIVSASITDGYNIVGGAVTAHTLFPASWIFSGGQWHRYMPHIYTNNKWIPAPAFVYNNYEYLEPNGE